jgi:hypothetical protein
MKQNIRKIIRVGEAHIESSTPPWLPAPAESLPLQKEGGKIQKKDEKQNQGAS